MCCPQVLATRNSCHSAAWAPDSTRRLLTISIDDTLRVWGQGGHGGQGCWEVLRTVAHDNQTGRSVWAQGV